MLRVLRSVPRTAFLLTGVTIGAVIWNKRKNSGASTDNKPLQRSLADLEARLAVLEDPANGSHSIQESDNPGSSEETKVALASLEASLASLNARFDGRMSELEHKITEHDTKLQNVPTLTEIVSTMEQMLTGAMSGLDQKLSEQVHSIEMLKSTVSQSDELMEKVLDSIYSLQSHIPDGVKPEVTVSV